MDTRTAARFWVKVTKTDTCWIWTGATGKHGHGQFWFDGRLRYAYRFLYEDVVGLVPDGLVLDHAVCQEPRCVRPDHLEPVTQGENVRRGAGPTAVNAARTHCVHGHEFTLANTYLTPDGRRRCRECWRLREVRRRQERRSRAA